MKNKLWLLQIPIVILFTFGFLITELGVEGSLDNALLRDRVFPVTRGVSEWFTDRKFRIRGPREPKNKIVVVEIDNDSIQRLGRWPWHRDLTAYLIDKILQAGAKVVGTDIMFPEAGPSCSGRIEKCSGGAKLRKRS